MVVRAVEAALVAGLGPVIAVTGMDAPKIEKIVKMAGAEPVHNPDYENGMGVSIAAGIAALADAVDGAVICLGDMPEINPETIKALVRGFDPDAGHGICVPVMDGRRGNPVLFGAGFFPALQKLEGDRGGKAIIAANPGSVLEVAVEDDGIFIDHDEKPKTPT